MKKIGILALVLVMAVGGMGVGFAHWAGTLDISGTVEMEDCCVGWYQVSVEDPRPPAPPANLDYIKDLVTGNISQGAQDIGWAYAYLDVPVCTCDIPLVGTGITHYETIVIELNNVYPGYYVDYQVHYHNCGLPVRVTAITPEYDPELMVVWTNGTFPFKMETCQTIASSLEVWVLQSAVPGSTYTFSVTIEFEQWQ
jgi:hypothetical protein